MFWPLFKYDFKNLTTSFSMYTFLAFIVWWQNVSHPDIGQLGIKHQVTYFSPNVALSWRKWRGQQLMPENQTVQTLTGSFKTFMYDMTGWLIQPFERFYICNKMPREGEILIHSIKTSVFQQNTHFIPSKHARSNPEAFWLWPVMAITASMQPELGRIVYARSDFSHPFQLHFSKEGMDHIVQNRPGSDLDGLVRVWPNASGLEASWCAGIIGPGFWQDATGPLPVSHFQTRFPFFHRRPG